MNDPFLSWSKLTLIKSNFFRKNIFFFLFCNANDDVLADEVDNGLGGLVLLSLGVDVFKFQLDIRQEARAVVDPLDGVTQCAGYGSSLSEKIQNGNIILIQEVSLEMIPI